MISEAEKEQFPLDEKMLGMLVEIPFNHLAAQKGEHWKLKPDESVLIGSALKQVADKYAPNIANEYGVEINLVLVLGAVLIPRMMTEAEIQRLAQEAQNKKQVKSENGQNNSIQNVVNQIGGQSNGTASVADSAGQPKN